LTPGQQARLAALLAEPGVARILPLLDSEGGAARIVGGAVRNALIEAPATDIDIATTLTPEAVMARMRAAGLKTVPTGVEHGTVTVVVDRRGYEVTTLRRDVATDGRRATVAFTDSFAEDALRRDFTINQLALSADGVVHDHAHGLEDLAARRVRFIGDAGQRIGEDYLRILRFFRFSAEHGEGPLDAAGLAACAALAPGMAKLSRERVWSETKKLLAARRGVAVMASVIDRGIWRHVAPLPADLGALTAAAALSPQADAISLLAALCVRTPADPGALDTAFRLSAAERGRLDAAVAARAFLLAAPVLDVARYRGAAFRHGAAGARDGLLTLTQGLNHAQARAWMAMPAPVSPFRGADVVALGVPAGPEVGRVIARAEAAWEAAGFPEVGAGDLLRRAVASGS
jgi:poly(A) polymerase